MTEEYQKNHKLINHVAQLLESDCPEFDDYRELIIGMFMILLGHPRVKRYSKIILSKNAADEIEGSLLDKIARVINLTYLMMKDKARLNDDTAIELIRDYLLENDEFVLSRNQNKLLRPPTKYKK